MRCKPRTGIVGLFLLLLGMAGYEILMRMQDASLRASCRPHVVLSTCNDYADKHDGQFPPLAPVPGMLFYDLSIFQETECFNLDNLCPSDRQGEDHAFRQAMYDHPRNDWSYLYLGYVLQDEAQVSVFVTAYRRAVAHGRSLQEELDAARPDGTTTAQSLRRLQSLTSLRAARDPLAARAASIPVVIEWPENHRARGGHVVFLDGHREFMAYPGTFPMTEAVISALRALDNYAPEI